jgi:hypothetical protein
MATAAAVAALLLVVGEANAGRGSSLLTRQGVLTLDGQLSFDINHVNPDGGNSESGVQLNISPSFGGFVANNFLLQGGLAIQSGFGDLYDGEPTEVSFGFGFDYLFNFGSIVVPHVGFMLGPAFEVPDQDNAETTTSIVLSIPAGILIALNEHVALDLGTRLDLSIGVSGDKATIINLPIGFLGVRSFF